jgi:hypothetical protein
MTKWEMEGPNGKTESKGDSGASLGLFTTTPFLQELNEIP